MRFIRRCCPKCKVHYPDSWAITSFVRGNLECVSCGHVVSLSLAARVFTIMGTLWVSLVVYGVLQVGVVPAFVAMICLAWTAFFLQISRQIEKVRSEPD